MPLLWKYSRPLKHLLLCSENNHVKICCAIIQDEEILTLFFFFLFFLPCRGKGFFTGNVYFAARDFSASDRYIFLMFHQEIEPHFQPADNQAIYKFSFAGET
jgi:hypothetical protein